jgi:hypothetical protein
VTRLVREGLIVSHRLDYTSKRFLRSDVEGLLMGLARGIPTGRQPYGSDPLPAACRKAGIPLATACRNILNGMIKPVSVGPGRLSLARIFVKVSDLRSIQASNPGLSIHEAAQALRIHHEVARHLVRCNFLSFIGTGPGKRIDPTSIARFHRTYITASELARDLHTSPRYVTARLSGFEVHPVIGPPQCRQIFFARARIEGLLGSIGRTVRLDFEPPRALISKRARRSNSAMPCKTNRLPEMPQRTWD